MTISSTTRKAGPYTVTPGQTAFPFAFKVFQASDVVVTQTDLSGAENTVGAGYTVALNSDQNANPGGTVNFAVAPTTGFLITLTSGVIATQSVQLTNGGNFLPAVLNDAFDRVTILCQQLAEQVGRAVKVSVSSSSTPDQLIADINTAASNAASSASAASASAAAAGTSATNAAASAVAAASTPVAAPTHAAGAKGTPVDADELPLLDSAGSFGLVKLTWANLKATLKTYFDTLYSNSVASPVRQTVLGGATNSSGQPAAFSIGSGLAVNLAATTTPMVITAAGGFSSSGAVDTIERIATDVTGVVTLPASNTSYIYRALASAWGSTLAPPQYGATFDQTKQACLSLNNISTDDFGNSWTNTAVTFSNTSPAIVGTYMGVFNGTTSRITTTAILTLGSGGWTMRGKFKPGSLPGVGSFNDMFSGLNAGNTFGARLGIYNNAGTIKFAYSLSSTGSTQDIANAVQGTTTPVVSTSYDVELNYDGTTYRLYVNGAQESSTASASKVCAITSLSVGSNGGGNGYNGAAQGLEFLPYCAHPAGTTFTVPTTLPNVAAAGYASDWFSTVDYKMYSVSAASASAGTNPTFTSSNKVYVGESVTGAATVTSVTNYAYQGRYDSGYTSTFPNIATQTSFNHNLGIDPQFKQIYAKCLVTDLNYAVGDVVVPATAVSATISIGFQLPSTPKTISFTTGATNSLFIANKTTGAGGSGTLANWAYRVTAQRGW